MYTTCKVEIYHKYNRIALHQRSLKAYNYTTVKEHLAREVGMVRAGGVPDAAVKEDRGTGAGTSNACSAAAHRGGMRRQGALGSVRGRVLP